MFDGIIRFTGVKDPAGYSYNYNPCASFTGKNECTGVQVTKKCVALMVTSRNA